MSSAVGFTAVNLVWYCVASDGLSIKGGKLLQREERIPSGLAVAVTGTGNEFVWAHPSPLPKSAAQQDKVTEICRWEVCLQELVCSMNLNAPNKESSFCSKNIFRFSIFSRVFVRLCTLCRSSRRQNKRLDFLFLFWSYEAKLWTAQRDSVPSLI